VKKATRGQIDELAHHGQPPVLALDHAHRAYAPALFIRSGDISSMMLPEGVDMLIEPHRIVPVGTPGHRQDFYLLAFVLAI